MPSIEMMSALTPVMCAAWSRLRFTVWSMWVALTVEVSWVVQELRSSAVVAARARLAVLNDAGRLGWELVMAILTWLCVYFPYDSGFELMGALGVTVCAKGWFVLRFMGSCCVFFLEGM